MKTALIPRLACVALLLAAPLAAQSGAIAFAPHADVDLSSSMPKDAAVGDFDGDGRLDVVVACAGQEDAGAVNVILNDGYPQIDGKDFPTGGAPWGVCAADLDGDGLDDLAVANGTNLSTQVPIFLSNGNGTFTQSSTLTAGGFPIAVKAGDFDEDGKLDLAVACNVSGGLKVYLGHGDGTFGAASSLGGSNLTDLALGDVDGDGHVDIATSHYGGATIYRGLGDGSFASWGSAGTGVLTEAIALGDLNGDGRDDAATVEIYTSYLRVSLSQPGGGLQLVTSQLLGGFPREVEIADVNGDGLRDVVAVSESGNSVTVMLGTGGGALAAPVSFATPSQPNALAVVDLDAAGGPELVVACRNLGDTPPAAFFVNQSPAPEWTVTGAALVGTNGAAAWTGAGMLSVGSQVGFTLQHGAPSAPAVIVAGLSAANLPFFGGVLVPAPDILVTGVSLDAAGALAIPYTWPSSLGTSGAELYTQVWFLDLGAPQLVAASNGLAARVP